MIWNLLARLLATRWIADAIIRLGQHGTPFHIMRRDGSLYMGRWWLVKWQLLRNVLPAVRLHHLADRDLDRHKHDHPWPWRSIILRNGYVEEDVRGRLRVLSAGMTNSGSAETFHRIVDVRPDTWTLFFTWRWTHMWGFLVDGRKVEHEVYEGYIENFGVSE